LNRFLPFPYKSHVPVSADQFGLGNCPKPAEFPAFEKLFFALISARMDRAISENQQHGIARDHQLDDAAAKTSRLGQVNGLDVELEFVEDKENRLD